MSDVTTRNNVKVANADNKIREGKSAAESDVLCHGKLESLYRD